MVKLAFVKLLRRDNDLVRHLIHKIITLGPQISRFELQRHFRSNMNPGY